MRIRFRVTAGAIVALIASLAWSQNPEDCAAVKFSDELLERFPRAPEACLDVISREGQDYAVFNARLSDVSGNTMRLRFRHPDGSLGPMTSVRAPRDFRVLVDGEPTRVSDLAPNQELKAYVHVSRPELALEPADTSQHLLIVPLAFEPARAGDRTRLAQADTEAGGEPEMPATAGPAPLFAGFGVLFASVALGLRALRGMRAQRRRRNERNVPM
jgi:hypothetical protein